MQCTSPMRIKNPDRFKYKKPLENIGSEWLEVPCGHCLACRIARSREWAIRLLHEMEFWDDSIFVTLTYDEEQLPEGRTLVPRDLTLFFKKLRRDLEKDKRKCKYFACGEYGGLFGRPHYHFIGFGLSVKDRNLIKENWNKGRIHIGTVTYKSCRYVAGYVQKKLYGKGAEYYDEQGILPPFSRCSKGLGERYIEKYWNKLWTMETVTVNGVSCGLPRYYKKKLDYDGFLNYDVSKEMDFKKSVLSVNQEYISFLDSEVRDGLISRREADAELEALFYSARIESNAHREANVEAKYSMNERSVKR